MSVRRSIAFLRVVPVVAAAFSLGACADDLASPALRPSALRASLADSAAAPRTESITIAPDTARVVIGRSTHLAAIVRDTAGAAIADRAVRWSSSDTTVASVDSAGVVTGIAVGAATITAASDSLSTHAVVTVHDGSVYSVAISPRAMTVVAGDTITLAATSRDAQDGVLADRAIRWESSAPSIVAVDSASGAMTARAAGDAFVVAADGARRDSVSVTVVPGITGVRVVTPLDTLEAHDTRHMQAVYVDSADRVVTHGPAVARRTLRWASSDTSIARIDSVSGVLTGVDRGTVTITATSDTLVGTAKRVVVILYRSLTAGSDHACDLASGGIAWCWGKNGRQGMIGGASLDDKAFSAVPVRVPGPHRFVQLTTYGTSTCGLTAQGKAYCWGYDSWGLLGTGDSRLYQSSTPVAVTGNLVFRQLSAGGSHVCGVTVTDKAYCWGEGAWGQFGAGNTRSANIPTAAAPTLDLATITAGRDFTCGTTLRRDTYCWGYSGAGNLGDGAKISYGNTLSNTPVRVVGEHAFRTVSSGNYYSCAIDLADAGWCWGSGTGGVLGSGSTPNTSAPTSIAGDLKFRAIATGTENVCGIATDAAVYCWGPNRHGQLGGGTANGATRPTRVADVTAAEISAANASVGFAGFTCAVSVDRLTTSCWGRNDVGQLGNGATLTDDVLNNTVTIVAGQKPLPAEKP